MTKADVAEAADTNQPPTPDKGRRLPRGIPFFAIIAVAVLALLAGGAGGAYQGKLSEVQKNDNSSYLPASAESTKAGNEAAQFNTSQLIPGFLVFHRESGLTAADKQAITSVYTSLPQQAGVDAQAITPPTFSKDGTTASIYVPLIAKQNGVAVSGDQLADHENAIIDNAKKVAPDGLLVYPAGAGGLLVAFIGAFAGLDGTLLLTAGGIVILILLLVYRSPVLWFFPLFSAVLALGLSSMVIYYLAKNERADADRTESGHPLRPGPRRRDRLRPAADLPISGGVAQLRPSVRRDDQGLEGVGARPSSRPAPP